ncbi:DUF6603 domain-containing protein [Streptomyces poriticola]|uniref:DUF6603 domain-containing protein n=1 Tax=Streptomyces poriticola TaxID=3120506 RepID=UPI002FCE3F7C
MAEDQGTRLLRLVSRTFVSALEEAAAAVMQDLAGLPVDERFAASPYAGRILQAVHPDHPALAVLDRLSADAGTTHAGLHGWRDTAADDAPHGLAFVATSGDGAVALLSVVPQGHPAVTVRAAGFSGGSIPPLPLPGGFTLTIGGNTPGELAVGLSSETPPAVLQLPAGSRVELALARSGPAEPVGVEGGPAVQFGAVSTGAFVGADPTGELEHGGHLRLTGGEVVLAPGFLRGMLPVDLAFPLELDLQVSAGAGVVMGGSPSLRTRLPGSGGRWLDLALEVPEAAGTAAIRASFETSLTVALPGAPVEVRVDGLGFGLPLSLKPGTPLLPKPAELLPAVPDGAGVSLDLPVVAGSGVLARIGDDLAGALSVRIPPMSASAFGVLSPARGDNPLSFLVVMGATFPPPGVQIGFGFAITGVGGVVGVNRRIDRDALMRAVSDGTAAQILFPSDPAGTGRSTIEALPAIFPAARGSVVTGPMFQVGWGGRIITGSVAVLVETGSQVRLTIMGKLVVALPDPAAPLVFLQVSFAGFIDPAEPGVMFVAGLAGSHIVGAPLTGDLMLLTRGGDDPALVISAGGFHPGFPVPRGVPPLTRLSMDLCPVPWIEMRCEAYFALTTNTLQLGAALELIAEVSGCGLRGFLEFDALVQYSPFRFVADISGGIALRVLGRTLMGVSLAFHLEGPAPYLARGRGSIDLFLFEVSFDFEIGWGSPAPDPVGGDVGLDLRKALADPAAWRSRGSGRQTFELTARSEKALEDATVVDPYGTVSVRQEVVPLGVEIRRYGGVPVQAQRWDLTGGDFAEGEPAEHTVEIRADFAPGMFVPSRSDDDALTKEAFVRLRSGMELHPESAAGPEFRPADLVWEERVLARDIPMPVPMPSPVGRRVVPEILDSVISASFFRHRRWWTVPEMTVQVAAAPPVAAASRWSMAASGLGAVTGLELAQAVADSGGALMTVEAWEM